MSLATAAFGILAIKPKVELREDQLIARTRFRFRALTLFSYHREVRVDRARKVIEIHARKLWMLTSSRTIPFHRVDFIDLQYGSVPTDWSWVGKTDQVESFRVSLMLKNPEERVPLFRFAGEGSAVTGLGGVLLGDTVVDYSGDQDEAARQYIDLLKLFLGVPLGRPLQPAADSQGFRFRCTECGRACPPNKDRCIYCGGPVIGVQGKVKKKKRRRRS